MRDDRLQLGRRRKFLWGRLSNLRRAVSPPAGAKLAAESAPVSRLRARYAPRYSSTSTVISSDCGAPSVNAATAA